MYKLFLSHASNEAWRVYEISKEIEEAGATVFFDSLTIMSGTDWEKEILKNLRECDEFWLVLSPTYQPVNLKREPIGEVLIGSIERPYVWLETGAAWYKGVHIVPILLNMNKKQFENNNDIPLMVKSLQAVDISDRNIYNQLIEDLKRRVRQNNLSAP